MSACMMAKFGSGVAAGAAAIAMVDAGPAASCVERHGIIGVLVVIALVLWAKSERLEKKADERLERADKAREERVKAEKERDEKFFAVMTGLTYAVENLKDHCAAVHREIGK